MPSYPRKKVVNTPNVQKTKGYTAETPVEKTNNKSMNNKKTETKKIENKKIEESTSLGNKDSIIVRVDNETQMLIQTIKSSISEDITGKLTNLESKVGGSDDNEEMMTEIKKINKRLDSVEDTLDDLVQSINSLTLKIEMLNKTQK